MASKIEWTEDTWNPIAGCSIMSPGCHNCYAARMAQRLATMGQPKYVGTTKNGHWNGKINFDEKALQIPLLTKKPTMYFVNSMSDLFHESLTDQQIDMVFGAMHFADWHTYQILTKRADRMHRYLSDKSTARRVMEAGRRIGKGHGIEKMNRAGVIAWPLNQCWIGVSVEDRKRLDRLDYLCQAPAHIRMVSMEPLLDDLGDLSTWLKRSTEVGPDQQFSDRTGIRGRLHWIIIGGESGPGARLCDLTWIRSIVRQCRASGVACFVKQIGSRPLQTDEMLIEQAEAAIYYENAQPEEIAAMAAAARVPIKLRHRKGGNPAEWPDDLRVREMPKVEVPA